MCLWVPILRSSLKPGGYNLPIAITSTHMWQNVSLVRRNHAISHQSVHA